MGSAPVLATSVILFVALALYVPDLPKLVAWLRRRKQDRRDLRRMYGR